MPWGGGGTQRPMGAETPLEISVQFPKEGGGAYPFPYILVTSARRVYFLFQPPPVLDFGVSLIEIIQSFLRKIVCKQFCNKLLCEKVAVQS